MESSDLRIFEAVARAGGITRAAAELNTVQSNVTARLRLLERELGTPLFFRHSRGVTLTPAGRELLPYAGKIGVLLAEARRALNDATPQGALRIGSLETTAGLRLPPILAAYTTAHPQVDITLQTGTTAELIAAVLAYRLEGALVAGPVEHPELVEETIFEEELVLVTAPAWPGIEAWAADPTRRKNPGPPRRVLVSSAPRAYSGSARSRGHPSAGVRHARRDHRLRGGGDRDHVIAEGCGRACVSRRADRHTSTAARPGPRGNRLHQAQGGLCLALARLLPRMLHIAGREPQRGCPPGTRESRRRVAPTSPPQCHAQPRRPLVEAGQGGRADHHARPAQGGDHRRRTLP